MATSESPALHLYVQSRRAVTRFYRPPAPTVEGAPPAAARQTGAEEMAAGEETYFLSDDQARCLALTEEIAKRRGYRIEVIDVARRVERLIAEHLKGVAEFPALVTDSGARLEGVSSFTEERISAMMPAEMPVQRAFTWVKVKGGELAKTRSKLLAFDEVREAHLLTGDWDVFLVLEFPGEKGGGKRQVLDFVTTRIRTMPDVGDTSTIVPEYSVTKFSF